MKTKLQPAAPLLISLLLASIVILTRFHMGGGNLTLISKAPASGRGPVHASPPSASGISASVDTTAPAASAFSDMPAGTKTSLAPQARRSAKVARIETVQRLAARGTTGIQDIIERLARAQNAEEKTMLADTLLQMGTPEAMQAFSNAVLAEKEAGSRADMMRALDITSTPDVLELATSFLGITNDPAILDAVTRTIARMGGADTVQFLGELYGEDENVQGQRQNVLAALGALHNPAAVSALASMLNQTVSDELCLAIEQSLAKIGTPDAVTSLVEAFDHLSSDRFVERQGLIQQLSAVRNRQSASYLEYLAGHSPDPLVQEAARRALNSLPGANAADTPANAEPRPDFHLAKMAHRT